MSGVPSVPAPATIRGAPISSQSRRVAMALDFHHGARKVLIEESSTHIGIARPRQVENRKRIGKGDILLL